MPVLRFDQFPRLLAWLGSVLTLCGALSSPALAQSPANIDRAVAGQTVILQRFTPPPQMGSIGLGVQDERRRIDIAAAEKVSFILRSVTVDGVRTMPPGSLPRLWADRIGTRVTLADVYRLADAIDGAYLAAGYFSNTVVPVQDFQTGHVRIQVYESYVQQVEITSDIPGIETRLRPYIDRIMAMNPIRVKEAERLLLLMADLGGLEIEDNFLRPETPTGGSLLKLDVQQEKRSGLIGLDNLGSDAVGPLELSGQMQFNDVFGLFESTNMVVVLTPNDPSQMMLFQFSQDYPVGHNGLAAGYSLIHLAQNPGGPQWSQDINIQSAIGTAYLAFPFVRTIDTSLFGRAELTARNDKVNVAGDALSRSKTRWATFLLHLDHEMETGSLMAEGGMNFSVASDIDMGDVPGNFRFVNASVDYTQSLGRFADLRIRGAGQYSPKPLPGAVQFALGGDPYGWAFDNGTLSGESGVATTVELSRKLDTGWGVLPDMALGLFADYGSVWNDDGSPNLDRDSLGSWGLGVKGMLNDAMQFEIIAVRPWKIPEEQDSPGKQLMVTGAVIPL
ncbi:ShlB/FhaC/HecB family hemolysin secretion/activation protein [Chachezhania sediminis]|uniref:ShlB/FhaC/HecB family hemolysin secretion/activation protein n=1 Tax=Chachezhania sediminis TaxID=2599291 RepID=UPI00131D115A|nr:ShlB/FhaC/HecB family hemolysin secretion/activation protein [Chachezhania sediminis]